MCMKTDWLAIAQDIAEHARAQVAEDQRKLDSILKYAAAKPAEKVATASR
jgi:hypothetical protein